MTANIKNLLFFVAFFSVLSFFSCKNETPKPKETPAAEPLTLMRTKYEKDDGTCNGGKNTSCAHVLLEYPVFSKGSTGVAEALNKNVQQYLIKDLKSYTDSLKSLNIKSFDEFSALFIDEFRALKKESPKMNGGYEVLLTMDSSTFVTPKIVSLAMNHYSFLGGAHPSHATIINNYDATTGAPIDTKTWVKDEAGLAKLVEAALKKSRKLPDNVNWEKEGFFIENGKFPLPENMGISDKGIRFHYNPYEIAAYALGDSEFVIPFDELKTVMNIEKMK